MSKHAHMPQIAIRTQEDGGKVVMLTGCWTLDRLAPLLPALSRELAKNAGDVRLAWNCQGIVTMDSAGALLLWRAWRGALPEMLQMREAQRHVFERLAAVEPVRLASRPPGSPLAGMMTLGRGVLLFWGHVTGFLVMIGQLALDCGLLLRYPKELPWREVSANLYKSGVRAMPVTALVGFLIGVVMSYLSALQLKQLGGEVFIVNILGMGIIRELGPVLVAVLVAGRSGSAMTAQLGVMRVTEEIDALSAMGVSRSLRLIFPKVVALLVAMPLLVLWLSSIALMGGMVSAEQQLDVSYGYFVEALPKVVPIANLWIGLGKGLVFGAVVALVACHFGLRVQPNTESLSANTTSSVVVAITLVILVDAVIAILTRKVGLF
jgi:phospholipid/cholesterol/gamma-HCH transport system permease protein